MSIRDLLENTDGRNLAEDIAKETDGEQKLMDIGRDVKERFEQDQSSMEAWANIIDQGLELIKQDFTAKSEPFDGASNYKSPILPEAVISFGDKATLHLLAKADMVKGAVIGRDPDQKKQEAIDRVTEFMNYELNFKMPEWKQEQEEMLYRMPLIGNLFKKTYFDKYLRRNVSSVIEYPNFVVNQASINIDSARSFTEIISIDRNTVKVRQDSGEWIDTEIYYQTENPQADEGSNEANDVDEAEGNDDRFLEQHCVVDLDDDGYAEPYIVTVHESTGHVVKIVARYNEDTITVLHKGRYETLTQALTGQAQDHLRQKQLGTLSALNKEFEAELGAMELYSIEPNSQITSYSYYPSLDGTFLGWGLFHLAANLLMANNASTNLLMDASQLATLGGGFLAKGFRKVMGPVRLKLGQWMATNVDPQDLQAGMLPNPTRDPSPTLFSMNEKLEQQFRQLTLIASDETGGIQANTAPTTALAMIGEKALPTSALLRRITSAEGREFKKLFQLDQKYTDEEEYQLILDDEKADFKHDFNNKLMDIIPVANPELSSKTQRIQLAETEMLQFDRVMAAGGNPLPIIRNYFDMIGTEYTDAIFPGEDGMSPEDKKQLQAMTAATEKQNQMMEVQISLLQEQVKSEVMNAQSLAMERQAKVKEILIGMGKTKADIIDTLASANLKGEQAETEHLKNMISSYTADIEIRIGELDLLQRGTNDEGTRPNNVSALADLRTTA